MTIMENKFGNSELLAFYPGSQAASSHGAFCVKSYWKSVSKHYNITFKELTITEGYSLSRCLSKSYTLNLPRCDKYKVSQME